MKETIACCRLTDPILITPVKNQVQIIETHVAKFSS